MILTLKKLVKVILLLDFVYIWSLNILISVSFEKHNQLVRHRFKMFFKFPFLRFFSKREKVIEKKILYRFEILKICRKNSLSKLYVIIKLEFTC